MWIWRRVVCVLGMFSSRRGGFAIGLHYMSRHFCVCLVALTLLPLVSWAASAPGQLRVLFLGDNGHHRPADRFKQLQPVLVQKGIEVVYTDQMEDVNSGKLAG